jgi:hypothetical protein
MRSLMLAAAALCLAGASQATAAGYCRAFTQPECTGDKGCAWRAAHASGDINPKNGKAFKKAGKDGCHFSPKDAQAILAKQFGKN